MTTVIDDRNTQSQLAAYVRLETPKSGRVVAESGEIINLADRELFNQMFDIKYQTAENGAALLSRTCEITTEFYYYGLRVPAGREFVLFSRILTLGEGAYEIDAVTSAAGFTGGTEAYKTTLKAGASNTVTSSLYCGVTPTSETLVVRDQDFIDSGTGQGSSRASATTEAEGLLRIFGPGETGILRVKRRQAENYTANIRFVCWERALS
jgi:hypothetical protein